MHGWMERWLNETEQVDIDKYMDRCVHNLDKLTMYFSSRRTAGVVTVTIRWLLITKP